MTFLLLKSTFPGVTSIRVEKPHLSPTFVGTHRRGQLGSCNCLAQLAIGLLCHPVVVFARALWAQAKPEPQATGRPWQVTQALSLT